MLRDYQQKALDATYRWLAYDNTPAICMLPTGAGKSHVIAALAEKAKGRVLIIAHRKELLEQNASKFTDKEKVGIYSAGLSKRDTEHKIIVAGIQSIYKKSHMLGGFSLIIIDECHLVPNNNEGSSMYWKLLREYPDSKIAGFTATPYRTEDGPLIWGKVCFDYPINSLIEQGYLSKLTNKAVPPPDLSEVKIQLGDYNQKQLESVMIDPVIAVSALEKMLKYGHNRKSWLVFCVNVEHAQLMATMLWDNDINCNVITGETSAGQRAESLEKFKNGEVTAITNCNVLTVGFDAPNIDMIVLLRPTKSRCLHEQMVGRGLRLSPGKDNCLILDLSGNFAEHGHLGNPRWKYEEGKKIEDKDNSTKICPSCEESIKVTAEVCPECGFVFEPEPREIHHRDDLDQDSNILMPSPPAWHNVNSVDWERYKSRSSGKWMIRLTYWCMYSKFHEYLCVEHEGYARDKAYSTLRQMFEQHYSARDFDGMAIDGWSLDHIIDNKHLFPTANKLLVDESGQYPEIKDKRYEEECGTSDTESLSEALEGDSIPY